MNMKEIWVQSPGNVQPWSQPLLVSDDSTCWHAACVFCGILGTLFVIQAPGSSVPPAAYLLSDSCGCFSRCEFLILLKSVGASSLWWRPRRTQGFPVRSVAFLVGGMFSLSGLGDWKESCWRWRTRLQMNRWNIPLGGSKEDLKLAPSTKCTTESSIFDPKHFNCHNKVIKKWFKGLISHQWGGFFYVAEIIHKHL